MSFKVLRITPSRDKSEYGNNVVFASSFPTRDEALAAIKDDFDEYFILDNPAGHGGHIEIHEVTEE